jgi:subtilisin-like proprotein convertase family protein
MFFSAISSFLGKSIGNWTFRIQDAYSGDKGTLNSALLLFVQNHTHCQQKILKLMTLSCIQPNKGNFTIQFTSQSETE